MLEKYPGEVKVVFKNLPLRNHRFARQAAAAALAAGEQGKFWEFRERLFQNYKRLNYQIIHKIAEDLALDMEKFGKDMRDARVEARITRDMADAAEAGVRGTPTVFVNGRLLRNRTLAGFQEAVEKELGEPQKTDGS